MRSVRVFALATCLTSAGALGAVAAGTGSEGYVNIYNSTPGFVVTGFYTNSGHGWTKDWLTNVTLTPGEGAVAQFRSDPVTCHQRVAVGWRSTAGREIRGHPVSVNICEVSNVYFEGEKIFFD